MVVRGHDLPVAERSKQAISDRLVASSDGAIRIEVLEITVDVVITPPSQR